MPRSVLRVGTRGSALALAQAETIRKAVSNVITHRSFELVPITTTGDTIEGELPPLCHGALRGQLDSLGARIRRSRAESRTLAHFRVRPR